MLYACNDAGNNIDIEFKRIYFTNIATSFIICKLTKGVIMKTVADDYDGTNTACDGLDTIIKDLLVTAADNAFTSVYGTIF
jgi:hypothetical protein